jgi:hypothetical protein
MFMAGFGANFEYEFSGKINDFGMLMSLHLFSTPEYEKKGVLGMPSRCMYVSIHVRLTSA